MSHGHRTSPIQKIGTLYVKNWVMKCEGCVASFVNGMTIEETIRDKPLRPYIHSKRPKYLWHHLYTRRNQPISHQRRIIRGQKKTYTGKVVTYTRGTLPSSPRVISSIFSGPRKEGLIRPLVFLKRRLRSFYPFISELSPLPPSKENLGTPYPQVLFNFIPLPKDKG